MNLNRRTPIALIYFPSMIQAKTIVVLIFRIIYLKEGDGKIQEIKKIIIINKIKYNKKYKHTHKNNS